jgi:hypothetical protein
MANLAERFGSEINVRRSSNARSPRARTTPSLGFGQVGVAPLIGQPSRRSDSHGGSKRTVTRSASSSRRHTCTAVGQLQFTRRPTLQARAHVGAEGRHFTAGVLPGRGSFCWPSLSTAARARARYDRPISVAAAG